jgi:hypothetical protein
LNKLIIQARLASQHLQSAILIARLGSFQAFKGYKDKTRNKNQQ